MNNPTTIVSAGFSSRMQQAQIVAADGGHIALAAMVPSRGERGNELPAFMGISYHSLNPTNNKVSS
jgi:hypothetical protein